MRKKKDGWRGWRGRKRDQEKGKRETPREKDKEKWKMERRVKGRGEKEKVVPRSQGWNFCSC